MLSLSQPSFWEILHLESFLLFSQNSLISNSPLFLLAPFLHSFFHDLYFSFFSFSCFSSVVIVLSFLLKLVEHNDDVGVVFIITDHQLLRAFLCGTVHLLPDLLHLGSFFLDLWKVKSFSFGLSGIDWSNSWARPIYRWKASLTMLELATGLLTEASEAGPRESLVISPGISSKKSIQENAASDIYFTPIDGPEPKFFSVCDPVVTGVLMQKFVLPT